jgi:hypothetical protein
MEDIGSSEVKTHSQISYDRKEFEYENANFAFGFTRIGKN